GVQTCALPIWRLRLPEHHSVRGRQLHRAAGGWYHAVDFARYRAVLDLLLDVPVGPVRDLHRRADRARHSDLLRRAPVKPLDRRPARRTGPDEAGQVLE